VTPAAAAIAAAIDKIQHPVSRVRELSRQFSGTNFANRGGGKLGSHAASDLAFAMTVRGDPEANVKSGALAARFTGGPHVAASNGAEQRLVDWLAELGVEQSIEIEFHFIPAKESFVSTIELFVSMK